MSFNSLQKTYSLNFDSKYFPIPTVKSVASFDQQFSVKTLYVLSYIKNSKFKFILVCNEATWRELSQLSASTYPFD